MTGEKPFIVYQGSHGDLGASYADVILPSAAFTEENGTYSNVEGRIQSAHKVVPPPGDARENWQILRAVSEFVGRTLHVDDWEEVHLRLGQTIPFVYKKDFVEKSHSLFASEVSGEWRCNRRTQALEPVVDRLANRQLLSD